MTSWYTTPYLKKRTWFERNNSWGQGAWHRRSKHDIASLKTTGPSENILKSLFKRGCRLNKKCRCATVVQRAAWYCDNCYSNIKQFCNVTGISIFHAQVMDRNELKEEILIRLLSGI